MQTALQKTENGKYGTEDIDPRFSVIDTVSTREALELQILSCREGIDAVERAIPFIENAIRAAAAAFEGAEEWRLIETGAGSAGRYGLMDIVELGPTFGVAAKHRIGVLAGGMPALLNSVEGAEDDADAGRQAMRNLELGPNDVVIGIAASGRTKFTVAAIETARYHGAVTIGIANNAGRPLLSATEYPICIESGAEVIAGSTRLTSGTTQKIVLNMISNGIMIDRGKVVAGMMTAMQPNNDKLVKRALDIIQNSTKCEFNVAASVLEASGRNLELAITMAASGQNAVRSTEILASFDGNVRRVLDVFAPRPANI